MISDKKESAIKPILLSRYPLALSLLVGALIWEIIGRFFLDEIYFASFSKTTSALLNLFVTGEIRVALFESLSLFVSGFIGGSILGFLVGILIARIKFIGIAFENFVTLLYVTPPIALIPFVLTLIGFGYGPKSLIVGWFVFFPVCITTIEGARAVNPRLIEVAHSFRSSELRMWRDIVFPSVLPYSMSGIRQGIALGFVGVVAAEFLLDGSGIGLLLRTYSRLYETDNLFASVLLMTCLGLFAMSMGKKLEKRFSAWRA